MAPVKAVLGLVAVISRVWPWLGAQIASYLWFHPHGRDNSRYPDGAISFDLKVVGHEISGFTWVQAIQCCYSMAGVVRVPTWRRWRLR